MAKFPEAEEKKPEAGAYGVAEVWLKRISDAYNRLELESRTEVRDRAMSYIDGSWSPSGTTYTDLNDGLPAVEDVINATLPELPIPNIEPLSETDEVIIQLCEELLRQTFSPRVGRFESRTKEVLWDEFGWGIGVGKVVWYINRSPKQPISDIERSRQVERAQSEFAEGFELHDDDDHATHIQTHQQTGRQLALAGSPVPPELVQHIQEHAPRLLGTYTEHPRMERVRPSRFLYDPFAEEWEDRAWEAELVTEKIADLQTIPGVKNLTPENIHPNETLKGAEYSLENLPWRDAQIDVWKIHDRRTGKYLIIPAMGFYDTDKAQEYRVKPLLETRWPYPTDIYSIIVTRRNGKESIHGHSTAQLITGVLEEIARVNCDIRTHSKRHRSYKTLGMRGSLDAKGQATLTGDSEFAFLPGQFLATRAEHKPPPIPQVLLERREQLLEGLRKLLGSDAIATATQNLHQQSATEVSAREQFHDSRVDRRQKQVSDYLNEAGMVALELYKKFGKEAISLTISTQQGPDSTVLSPGEIPQKLKLQMDVSSVTATARNAKLAAVAEYYNKLLETQVGDPVKVMEAWGRNVGEKTPSRLFMDYIPEMQPEVGGLAGLPGPPQDGLANANIPFPQQQETA